MKNNAIKIPIEQIQFARYYNLDGSPIEETSRRIYMWLRNKHILNMMLHSPKSFVYKKNTDENCFDVILKLKTK